MHHSGRIALHGPRSASHCPRERSSRACTIVPWEMYFGHECARHVENGHSTYASFMSLYNTLDAWMWQLSSHLLNFCATNPDTAIRVTEANAFKRRDHLQVKGDISLPPGIEWMGLAARPMSTKTRRRANGNRATRRCQPLSLLSSSAAAPRRRVVASHSPTEQRSTPIRGSPWKIEAAAREPMEESLASWAIGSPCPRRGGCRRTCEAR